MMGIVFWLAVTLWAGAGPQTPSRQPLFELAVAVRVIQADGFQGAVAWTTLSDDNPDGGWIAFVPDLLLLKGCGVASGSARTHLPTSPGAVAWFVSGAIVRQDGDQFTIDVAVPRADGTKAARRRLVVRRGERVELDHVVAAPDSCQLAVVDVSVEPVAQHAGLDEVALDPRKALQSVAASGGHVPAALALSAYGSTNGGSTEHSHWVTGAPVLLQALASAADDAELWLVHTLPVGAATTARQDGPLDVAGRTFAFPLETVPTGDGEATVEVAVNLRPMKTADQQIVLRASIARVVEGQHRTNPAPGVFVRSYGSSEQVIPMPAADAVVSFDLPPSGPNDPTSGHHFDLRVRITPHRSEDLHGK